MATAIHHGAPGSFKSFAVVQRHAIPALLQGRVVITNIRGFDSLETIRNAFLQQPFFQRLRGVPHVIFPSTARLYYFDTSTYDQRQFFATWYKWLPLGALLIIDEAQMIYPDRADFKLEHLDRVPSPIPDLLPFPLDDLTTTIKEGRPHDIRTAFDKQRHYNWDIFLTTTNIGKIKSDIRQSSEWAYRHRSLSEVSKLFSGQWYEHQHDTETSGKSESHRVGAPKRYKADKRVFNCYRSTATGEHIASTAGTKLFSDKGIKFKLFTVFIALFVFIYAVHKRFEDKPIKKEVVSVQNSVVPVSSTSQIVSHVASSTAPVKIKAHDSGGLSDSWHISTVIRDKKTKKFSVYATDLSGHYRRILPNDCIFDQYQQPSCRVDGEMVTLFSGVRDKSQSVQLTSND